MTERQYFELDSDMSLAAKPWYIWVNEDEMTEKWVPTRELPFGGLDVSVPLIMKFDKKKPIKSLRDAYIVHPSMWMVNGRLRELLESIDPEAFVFASIDMDYSNFDEPGPQFWLCDLVRFLDCVDEERSTIKCQEGIPMKNYIRLIDVEMKPEIIGDAHAFRLTHSPLIQIVDDVLVDALKKEKIRAFSFKPIKRQN
ncbi:DUF1629 domain-containing protein [Alloalcanivorax xenomutans]|uniref:imm11 family protein n=1 Tax=Alloalcanivorax xenomutans TaxID=1094342 RepID=UPI003A80FF98